MRHNFNVLWVDDTADYYDETVNLLKGYAEDQGVSAKFEYIENASEVLERLKKESTGFKLYDLILMDYSLSAGISGNDLIKLMREENISTDVLFYTSEDPKIQEMKDCVGADISSFEGVYIDSRDNVEIRYYNLLCKNAKQLSSITNIRGFLMDHTSENDYTVKSYIMKEYDLLTPTQKSEVITMITDYVNAEFTRTGRSINVYIQRLINDIRVNGITNISTLLQEKAWPLSTVSFRYLLFEEVLRQKGDITFSEHTISEYLDTVVNKRNILAHKKLEICDQQKFLKYYDNIEEYNDRICNENCFGHNNNDKISVEQWEELRKSTMAFGKCFDKIQSDF